jgi:2-oxoglutarate dehydrogenase E2 component (dihydrolipoamide succinyltransferase)
MTDIRVPTLGESVTEATVGKWFKRSGDAVAVDEPLVELETDKVTIEVPAPTNGILSDIVAKDGATVAVGALLGHIGPAAGAAKAAEPAGNMAAASVAAPPAGQSMLEAPAVAAPAMPLAPSVRRLAAESGIAPATAKATCWQRSSGQQALRFRLRSRPLPSRCGHLRRPTMLPARSACA